MDASSIKVKLTTMFSSWFN